MTSMSPFAIRKPRSTRSLPGYRVRVGMAAAAKVSARPDTSRIEPRSAGWESIRGHVLYLGCQGVEAPRRFGIGASHGGRWFHRVGDSAARSPRSVVSDLDDDARSTW